MNKKFNSISYERDFPITGNTIVRINKMLRMIGTKKTILDLGCGDGFIMEYFRKAGNKVIGVDIAKKAIEKAQKKGFKVYDLSLAGNWTPYISEKIDVVTAGEIIEHVFDTDKLLTDIHKILKKNGILVITTPNIATLGRRLLLLLGKSPLIETTARITDAGHIRYFTFATLKKLLEENNFKVIEAKASVVNFDIHGRLFSSKLADLFPTFGDTIIIKAQKV